MNQFKELREKTLTKQRKIKDDAMKYATKESQNSYTLNELQKKFSKAAQWEKSKLFNQLTQQEKRSRIHLFHQVYNRKYSDTNKMDKVEIIMDYDFPLK